jgi:hypothetical protein
MYVIETQKNDNLSDNLGDYPYFSSIFILTFYIFEKYTQKNLQQN